MKQVPLAVHARLPYSKNGYLIHAGVKQLVDQVIHSFSTPKFQIAYAYGGKRSGKTHTAVYLAEYFLEQDKSVLLTEACSVPANTAYEIYIFDQSEKFFENISKTGSGPFVSLIEKLRLECKKIIFFSSVKIEEMKCDEHVMSRLLAGYSYEIGAIDADQNEQLIKRLSIQRGVNLTPRKIQFISKRLGRDIMNIEKYLENTVKTAQTEHRALSLRLLSEKLDI
jgi:chromosomal replication initiation ATPase DnaA